jgi:hypothetical protein
LEADADCVNQTFNFDKTPLHLITEVLDDSNLSKVVVIIHIFSEFDGNFSWPARQSDNQTPFSMLLEKLATLKDKATCLQVIRYLITKNAKIDIFHKEKCAGIIRQHFVELVDEYQAVENWKEESNEVKDWKSDLEKLIVESEAEFLVKFDDQKRVNRKQLEEYILENTLIDLAIESDRFESFVEIYKINFNNIYVKTLVCSILDLNRCRILKYVLDHKSVEHADPKWMVYLIKQRMEDNESDINPKVRKCFHILLDHPKFNVNEQMPDYGNNTVLHNASFSSEYAAVELLKKGASLAIRNQFGNMAISYTRNGALKKFLDSCVTTCVSEYYSDIDHFMVFDYSFLKGTKEMPLIEIMTEEEDLQPLIEHPVITSFLFLKWLRLSNIFFLNLLLFSANALCFIFYLIHFYVNQEGLQDSSNYGWYLFSLTLAYGSFVMFSTKEIIQFIGSPSNYLRSVENYLEIGVISLITVTLSASIEDQHTRRSIAAVLYLGFGIEWTLMFSALPVLSISNYMVMLKKVAINFLRTLAFYSIILMAFAASFYTLTNKTDGNLTTAVSNETREADNSNKSRKDTMFSVIVQVILMLTGGFEDISKKVEDSFIGTLFLLVFVLSMSIVLMNLLIGITVSDTAAIGREAEWNKWWERAKMLIKYESMAWNWYVIHISALICLIVICYSLIL